MSRAASCFRHFLALWLLNIGVSSAQTMVQLTLKPDRMQHAKSVEQQAIATHDSLLLAEAWYLYGKTYVFAGDYRTAQDYFLKSLRIHEPRGDSFELSRLYVRLSENEDRTGHVQKALQYATRSLHIAQRIRSDMALVRSYGALGRIYERLWEGRPEGNRRAYDRILYVYKKKEYLSHKLRDTLGIAEVSVELGTLFTRVKNPQAVGYLEKALAIFTAMNKEGIRVNAMLRLAAAYLTFDKPRLAFQTMQNAEKLYAGKKLNEYDVRLVLERGYVDYFQAVGQWKAAFEHLGKLNTLEKNQLMADNNGAIARLSVEYETETKEARFRAQNRELTLSDQNLRTQRRFTRALSALFVLAVSMSLIFFRLYRKNQRISRQNEELVKEQNHRVKNNLQVVASLLSLQSKRLTDEQARKAVEESWLRVESMAILHRRLYDDDKLARVSVDEFSRELVSGVLKSYGYHAIRAQFSIDTISLSADKAVPFGLILNELTTNACKYAFPNNDDPQFSISCHRKANRIELNVTDNGPGLAGPGLERVDYQTVDNFGEDSDGETIATVRQATFGLQLIQAQVEQLYGRGWFGAGGAGDTGVVSPGTQFTLKFTV